jgi:hypothetical protein
MGSLSSQVRFQDDGVADSVPIGWEEQLRPSLSVHLQACVLQGLAQPTRHSSPA